MSEGRAAFDITPRVDARHIGFQSLVDLDKTVFICFNAGGFKVEPVGVGGATRGDQQVRAGESLLPFRGLNCQLDLPISLHGKDRICIQQNLKPFLTKNLGHFVGYIGVFTCQQPLTALDDGHFATKAVKHLAKFQADVTAAQDQ